MITPGVNDWATANPDFVTWWNDDQADPGGIAKSSQKVIEFKCPAGHSFTRVARHFSGRCAKCETAGRSFLSRFPEMSQEWSRSNPLGPDEVSYNSAKRIMWECKSCRHKWETAVYQRANSNNSSCPKCSDSKMWSSAEDDIATWLTTGLGMMEGVDFVRGDRKLLSGKELDFVFPKLNMAVEFNGVYWHSEEKGKGRWYHHDKWKACKDQGIQFIQIWCDDWKNRTDVVKNLLAHKLGKSQQPKVYARKTTVDPEVPKKDAEQFLLDNHIQGYTPASHYLGLREKTSGELVAVMLLRKQGKDLVLQRYAASRIMPGGQGKLLRWVEDSLSYENLITFADLCLSDGDLYEKTGWTKDKFLRPDYSYLRKGERTHKFRLRLSRFKSDPDLKFKEGKSESELARLNNIPRVWDAGKIRYVKPHPDQV